MNVIELLTRFLVGGSLIVFVSLLAKTKYSVFAGLFVLFLIVTLVGYFFIGQSVDSSKLHEITLFSMYSLPTTFIFLFTFYTVQAKYKLIESLFISCSMVFSCWNNSSRDCRKSQELLLN